MVKNFEIMFSTTNKLNVTEINLSEYNEHSKTLLVHFNQEDINRVKSIIESIERNIPYDDIFILSEHNYYSSLKGCSSIRYSESLSIIEIVVEEIVIDDNSNYKNFINDLELELKYNHLYESIFHPQLTSI